MAFDSGFLAASLAEISRLCGSRIEKIHQPRNDEIDILLKGRDMSGRLVLRCGAGDARIALSGISRDNPAVPPNLCMLLRKHLQGSILTAVEQKGFERVAEFRFACRDELGYDCERRLYAEITGRNSNLIFTNGEDTPKILGAMRIVDFTTSRLRQVLPGMFYELPPEQEGKLDPRSADAEALYAALEEAPGKKAASVINSAFLGICPAVAREIVFRATGSVDTTAGECLPAKERLAAEFTAVFELLRSGSVTPNAAYEQGEGPFSSRRAIEFSYIPLTQYGEENLRYFGSVSELLDVYYGEKDRAALVAARASDLQHTLNNHISRLQRKLELQSRELADCADAEGYRKDADLIVGNLYKLKRGDRSAVLTDWSEMNENGEFVERTIKLDPLLTPSANAQKLYKKYSKCKKAEVELAKQIDIAGKDLGYLFTVRDALSRAETGADLAGIRNELERGGYIREKRNAAPAKSIKNTPSIYLTSGGYTVLCGRNNLLNEEITFKLSERGDLWFHAKGVPGSHVLLKTGGADISEIPDVDMTEACEIAALNSDAAGGSLIPVDYTDVKNIKKPAGAKPGYVIYKTNYTAYVTPDREKLAGMKKAK